MSLIKSALCALALTVASSAVNAAPIEITYPSYSERDRRLDYPLALMELALQKSGTEYSLNAVPHPGSNKRLTQKMAEESTWDVAFMGTKPEYEEALRTVYFPVFRGLLGNRIAITHRDNLERFDSFSSVSDFMGLKICQGLGWADTAILESAGFSVVTGKYANLFKVTAAKRCDAYTRAVFEPYAEVSARSGEMPDLVVDDSIMIRYHLPQYMFFAPDQEELAQAVERGLQMAVEDGSFRELFENAAVIKEARELVKPGERVCIDVENPHLSAESQALPDEYWGGFSFGDSDASSDCRAITS